MTYMENCIYINGLRFLEIHIFILDCEGFVKVNIWETNDNFLIAFLFMFSLQTHE